jgi:hypothetical protein
VRSRLRFGTGAYFFIAFSHFAAHDYNPYILPPAQNVTIIRNTVNVTNITYNKTIVNNFGPPVAMVQQKTGAVFKPVSLAYQPGKKLGSSISDGVLRVTGPGTKLNPVATKLPSTTIRNPNPVVDKGWKGVDTKTESELRSKFAKENPTPANLPKPTVTPVAKVLKGGVLPGATPKPGATVFGAATPPRGVKPLATGSPKAIATPFKSKGGFYPANPGAAGGIKSPSASPKPVGTPGRPGGAVTPGTQLQGSPTPKPTTGGGAGQTPPVQAGTPAPVPKPPEHSPTPAPTVHPTVHLATPLPTPHHSPPPVSTPHPKEPLATPPAHHATPTPHPRSVSTPKVVHKPEGGGAAQHNLPVYHPSGGGGNKPVGVGLRHAAFTL